MRCLRISYMWIGSVRLYYLGRSSKVNRFRHRILPDRKANRSLEPFDKNPVRISTAFGTNALSSILPGLNTMRSMVGFSK